MLKSEIDREAQITDKGKLNEWFAVGTGTEKFGI